ncbi:MAG: type II toxin-antitoxin system PemK/MazF family toxin [Nitrospirota bacterium]|nr:type II toxin-antitoxin system PemK/MazF family toxin [Nitrospirota bacterium]
MPFTIAYNPGDIVLIGFPYTDLQGVSKRPAVVLYDSADQDILAARITTQEYFTETDYKIINWKGCGLLAESYVRLSKQATIEKRYILKQLGILAVSEIENLKAILKKMFSL